ncbi:MAG TPA: hypothetical protein VFU13_05835 [Steroidobacteraceae bacterium]|nr:hypothetical protein [Steroidobacteraceae bacterium]
MKSRSLILLAMMFACGPVSATIRYTEARITQIETSDLGIYVFMQVVSGDAPPTGDGGTNEAIAKSYLLIANSVDDFTARAHLLSSALVALTLGTVVRFRWDDAGPDAALITHLLVRA